MININEYLTRSSEVICESFSDSRLYQIQRSLAKQKLSWKDIFKYKKPIAWDKIDSNDIEEIDNLDEKSFENMTKAARKVKAGKNERDFIIFGMEDEELAYIYLPEFAELYVVREKLWYYTKSSGARAWYQTMNQRDQFWTLSKSDYLLKVYIDEKTTSSLRIDRMQSRDGMVPDLTASDHKSLHKRHGIMGIDKGGLNPISSDSYYGWCEEMVSKAIKRWKNIIATNAAAGLDTTVVDKRVQDILTRLPKVASTIAANPSKYDDSQQFSTLIKSVYYRRSSDQRGDHYDVHGNNALLVLYQEYCSRIINIKTDRSYDKARDMTIISHMKKEIMLQCQYLDKELKKYE